MFNSLCCHCSSRFYKNKYCPSQHSMLTKSSFQPGAVSHAYVALGEIKVSLGELYQRPKQSPGSQWPRIKDLTLLDILEQRIFPPQSPTGVECSSKLFIDLTMKMQLPLAMFSSKESSCFFLSRSSPSLGLKHSTPS